MSTRSELLPADLSANPDLAFSRARLSSAQLYFLSPTAAKVLMTLANSRGTDSSTDIVTSRQSLARATRMSVRSVSRALDELRTNRLIQTMEARSEGGFVTGMRIRPLPAPPALPAQVATAKREELVRRRGKVQEELGAVNAVICASWAN